MPENVIDLLQLLVGFWDMLGVSGLIVGAVGVMIVVGVLFYVVRSLSG